MPKICKIQDTKKCQPWVEFEIWWDGSSSFHGTIRYWAFVIEVSSQNCRWAPHGSYGKIFSAPAGDWTPRISVKAQCAIHWATRIYSDIWAFQLAKLAGKAIFSTFPVVPPIIILEISNISEMIIRGVTGKVLKMAFPANMASWKAQNLMISHEN